MTIENKGYPTNYGTGYDDTKEVPPAAHERFPRYSPPVAGTYFNYGAGWGSASKPDVYYEALELAHELEVEGRHIQRRAWELQMVCRDLRLATDAAQKQTAYTALVALACSHRSKNT